jgi:outer membrane lipoprotein LolB
MAAAGLLAACAALTTPVAEPIPERPARADIAAFQLSGRVAVKSADQSFSARIAWRHGPDGSEHVLLSTPLGQGLAELTADRSGARLATADRQDYFAPDLDALSDQALGAPLPLSRLPRWAVGQVGAPAADVALDRQGRVLSFAEQGWRVAYLAYESEAPAALPTLIQVRRDDLELRLKVDEWNLAP